MPAKMWILSGRLDELRIGLQHILGCKDVGELEEVSRNQLSIEMGLLHHMTRPNFVPQDWEI